MAQSRARTKKIKQVVYRRSWRRSILLGLTVSVSVLSISALTASHWLQTRLFDTDVWVQTMNESLKKPQITSAMADYIASQIFDARAVEERVAETLPPDAAYLAAPLTTQLQEFTEKTTLQVVESDVYNSIWSTANKRAHRRIIENARAGNNLASNGERSERSVAYLDLSEVRQQILNRVGNVSGVVLPPDSHNQNKPIQLQADLQTSNENVRQFIQYSDFMYAVLPAFVPAGVFGSLAVARNRRRVLVYISFGTFLVALLQLIAVRGLRPIVINRIQDVAYKPAVTEVYESLTSSFNSSVYVVLLAALFVWGITLAAGSNRLFTWLRTYLRTTKLRNTEYYEYWQELRLVFAAYKAYIWTGFMVITLVTLAFAVDISWAALLNSIFVLVSFASLVQIIGSPPYYIKARRKY